MGKLLIGCQRILDWFRCFDFLALLGLRLYLVPVLWLAGTQKLMNINATIVWFKSLGFMYPDVMAYLASITEITGAVLLLIGLGVRWISIPLMIVMAVAACSVHWDNGWLAIAANQSDAAQRLSGFMAWLQANFPMRHAHITELGKPVILNNGVEYAATYFLMLLVLFFYGAGRFFSVDYWLAKACGYKSRR